MKKTRIKKEKSETEQLSLSFCQEMIKIHCFFRCPHIVEDLDPYVAHRLMENHYQEKHAPQIARIVQRLS
jgi:hypothetical protein